MILSFYLSPAERPNEGEKQTVHTQIPMDVPPVDLFNTGPPIIEDEVCKTQPYSKMCDALFLCLDIFCHDLFTENENIATNRKFDFIA